MAQLTNKRVSYDLNAEGNVHTFQGNVTYTQNSCSISVSILTKQKTLEEPVTNVGNASYNKDNTTARCEVYSSISDDVLSLQAEFVSLVKEVLGQIEQEIIPEDATVEEQTIEDNK